ncbi:DUF3304 domain-containing protein [Roseateles sp. BYS180W]|uniref:DUF3304 domain-containing protein n=1 Tax=Roseateles rivi TaxID=3299028 RepID=A0ABW7FS47_9BURK
MTKTRTWLVSAAVVLLLTGCYKAPEPDKDSIPTSIVGHNYTSEGIQEFYVDGGWGGGLGIGQGGASNVCCVVLPAKWRPGLEVTVEWVRSDCGGRVIDEKRCPPLPPGFAIGQKPPRWERKTLKKIVPIEPYERVWDLQVMFLLNDEVKIYSSRFDVIHPEHPSGLGKPRPLDNPDWKRPEWR